MLISGAFLKIAVHHFFFLNQHFKKAAEVRSILVGIYAVLINWLGTTVHQFAVGPTP